jgi:osmotically-inducible protein OsmY
VSGSTVARRSVSEAGTAREHEEGSSMNRTVRWTMASVAAVAAAVASAGCAPLLMGGAVVGTALVATDRRSPGIQLEDQAIELRVNRALAAAFERGSINVIANSYNRRVLLTGEVRSEADKAQAGKIAAAQENVREVVNELYVGELSTFANRNNDTAITAKVKTALLRENNLPTNVVVVHTSRSVVYLMGRVGEPEGDLAARSASRVDGVRQVIKLFEYLSDDEWKAVKSKTPPPAPEPQRK